MFVNTCMYLCIHLCIITCSCHGVTGCYFYCISSYAIDLINACQTIFYHSNENLTAQSLHASGLYIMLDDYYQAWSWHCPQPLATMSDASDNEDRPRGPGGHVLCLPPHHRSPPPPPARVTHARMTLIKCRHTMATHMNNARPFSCASKLNFISCTWAWKKNSVVFLKRKYRILTRFGGQRTEIQRASQCGQEKIFT